MNAANVVVSYRNICRGLLAPDPAAANQLESVSAPEELGRSYQELHAELTGGAGAAGPNALTPAAAAAWLARLSAALTKLAAAERHPGVLTAVEDETASLVQSFLAQWAVDRKKAEEAAAGGLEAKFDSHDVGWVGSLVNWVGGLKKHAWQAVPAGPEACADALRVAVLGDWGTGLYGAPACAKSIRKDPKGYSLLLHLGDVYYSGTRQEVADRFLDLWPAVPGAVSRALNSNHEMYSGGHGYFEMTLPRFGQSSSCFAWQNKHWLLVGLDSAYAEHDLANFQAEWLQGMILAAGDRKVVLFSHHQPISLLSDQGPKLVAKLGGLLAAQKVFAWYWGHEHCCVLYDTHPAWNLRGRCIGHSGFPYSRARPKNAERVAGSDDAGWYRLPGNNLVPGGLLLDGPNPYLGDHPNDYGPNGYATLEFQDEHLTEFVHDPTGEVLWQKQLA